MPDDITNVASRVASLIRGYENHPSVPPGTSWPSAYQASWYLGCRELCDLLSRDALAKEPSGELQSLLNDERRMPKKLSRKANRTAIYGVLRRIQDELPTQPRRRNSQVAKNRVLTATVVEHDPQKKPNDYLHRPEQPKSADFLCIDLRRHGPDDALSTIDRIQQREMESPDGFMPPVVVVGHSGALSPEQARSFADRGAQVFEMPENTDATVDAAAYASNELGKHMQMAQPFAPPSTASSGGQQPAISSELNPYTSWPERLDQRQLKELFDGAAEPESPMKDD